MKKDRKRKNEREREREKKREREREKQRSDFVCQIDTHSKQSIKFFVFEQKMSQIKLK